MPVLGELRQRLVDDRLHARRHVHGGVELVEPRRRIDEVLVDHRHQGGAVEGRLTGQGLVEDDAHRVHVGPRVGLPTGALLRRHVVGGAEDHPGLGELPPGLPLDLGLGDLGQPEVHDLHEVPLAGDRVDDEEDVLRLQIPMDDPRRVSGSEGAAALVDDRQDPLQRQRPLALEHGAEVLSVEQLHDQVGERVRAPEGMGRPAEVEDVHDVRVAQPGGAPGLPLETAHGLAIVVDGAEHLHRDRLLDGHLSPGVDGAHPALPQHRLELVATVEAHTDQGVVVVRLTRRVPRGVTQARAVVRTKALPLCVAAPALRTGAHRAEGTPWGPERQENREDQRERTFEGLVRLGLLRAGAIRPPNSTSRRTGDP